MMSAIVISNDFPGLILNYGNKSTQESQLPPTADRLLTEKNIVAYTSVYPLLLSAKEMAFLPETTLSELSKITRKYPEDMLKKHLKGHPEFTTSIHHIEYFLSVLNLKNSSENLAYIKKNK